MLSENYSCWQCKEKAGYKTNLTFRVGDTTRSPVQVLHLAAAGSSFRRGQVNVVGPAVSSEETESLGAAS